MSASDRILDRTTLKPGDVLMREGEPGDCAFFVQSGRVGVYKQAGLTEVMLATLGKNSIVGEMALIDNSRRSATVRCIEAATIITVSRETFEKKLANLDRFSRGLLEMFSQKLRRLGDEYIVGKRQAEAPPSAAGSERTQRGIDRFATLHVELARLYHPECTKDRGGETLSRAQVFQEIWPLLEKIIADDHQAS